MGKQPLGKKRKITVDGRDHIVRVRGGKCTDPGLEFARQLDEACRKALKKYGVIEYERV